jgi:outer membrane protein OmpA-like peptidoglycan-associated protein
MIMSRIARAVVLACACTGCAVVGAQPLTCHATGEGDDVIVEAKAEEGGDGDIRVRAIWRSVSHGGAAFDLRTLSPMQAGERLMLDRLLEAAVGAYLDARLQFTRQGVYADRPAADLAGDIDAMIMAATAHAQPNPEPIALSASTRQQLDRLTRIDWSNARFGVDGGAEQDKYLAVYYYVRSQRQELERQLRADLLPLSGIDLFAADELPPGRTEPINSTCGTVFDQDNYLCALDLRLADTSGGLGADPSFAVAWRTATSGPEPSAPSAPERSADQPNRIRKRDRWLKQELDGINQRIDRMDQRRELWELRDRMEDIEDRITGLEIDVREVRDGSSDNPSANLATLTGRNITVRFDRSSVVLEPDQRVLLNEVFEQLARSPQDKVLITGYTDRSGDPARNLWLSEQRAKAVRSYLLARGINGDRLLVNYYGDSRSLGRDPGERRVELEWLR